MSFWSWRHFLSCVALNWVSAILQAKNSEQDPKEFNGVSLFKVDRNFAPYLGYTFEQVRKRPRNRAWLDLAVDPEIGQLLKESLARQELDLQISNETAQKQTIICFKTMLIIPPTASLSPTSHNTKIQLRV